MGFFFFFFYLFLYHFCISIHHIFYCSAICPFFFPLNYFHLIIDFLLGAGNIVSEELKIYIRKKE